MKVTLSNLNETYLKNYKLRKKFENNFSVKEMDNTVIYNGDNYKYLLESASLGIINETGEISKKCKDYDFKLDVELKHTEGKFNLKECWSEKKVILKNTLDCIIDKKINIFDFAATMTNTVEGEIYRINHYSEKIVFLNSVGHDGQGSVLNKLDLDDVFNYIGEIPDYSDTGYYPEYGYIEIEPIVEKITDPNINGDYEEYGGSKISMYVIYVQLWSPTQETIYWKPAPLGGYYYPLKNPLTISNENYTEINIFNLLNLDTFQKSFWSIGNGNNLKYIKTDISNTYLLNPIIEKIFECTGKNVISNFFGINPDGKNPDNEYYAWAVSFAQQIKIVQSFDIIRESAKNDSFGISGLIEVKQLIKDICLIFNLIISENEFDIYIEHKSFYTGKAIDLKNKDYEFSDLEINKDLIDREIFQYAQNFNDLDHYEAMIKYNKLNIYEQENVKTYKTDKIVTDVFSAINKEKYNESQYEKLFFLLLTNGNSILSLNDEMAFSNIVKRLHDLDRPLKKAKINNNDHEFLKYSIGFESEIKIKSSLEMFNLLEPFMSVKTDFGTFVIQQIEIDENDLMTLKIKK